MSENSVDEIRFYTSEDKTSDELGGAMPLATNVVVDSAGAVHNRPGISTWNDFPGGTADGSAVIGMTVWKNRLVWVTADRRIRALPLGGAVLELSDTSDATTMLDGGLRPCFVEGRDLLIISGGGYMQKWSGVGLSARLTNTGAGGPPPPTNACCGIAQRLVAALTGDSGQIWWSGPLEDYENWDMSTGGSSYIQAAAKPDPLVNLSDNTNEVFAWGQQTLQVFAPANLAIDANDPNNLLDFAPARTQNVGLTARDSVLPVDDTFAILDRLRRIVVTDGRSYKDISVPIVKLLRDFEHVNDCWSFRMRSGKWDCLVFMFPTIGRGLIWNANSSVWSEWIASGDGGEPTAIPITAAYHWAEQDVFLVGMSDGSIARIDDSATTDLGAPIKIRLVSGFVTHGVTAQKACSTLMLAFRKNLFPTAASGRARLSMRDDLGAWEPVDELSLSDGPTANEQIRSIGVYRQRQWMVDYTGEDGFSLVSVHEEFQNLGA